MITKQQNYQHQAETVIKNLKKRQMEGFYCETKEDAVKLALSMMKKGDSVAWGGSMSVVDSGLAAAVKANSDLKILDRDIVKNEEERKAMYADIENADFFLMSTNAITFDGELVNIDCRGNRVSFLCYGPQNVIVLTGMNKLVSDVDSGIKRVKDIATPANAIRLNRENPCAVTGKCGNCFGKGRLCAQTVITTFSPIPGRIKVILVGEELGY